MGVTTVVKDYGTAILDAIRDNDLKKLRSILEKQLKADHKIAALCITDIRHRPTKKFACPLILAARQEDPTILQYMLDHGTNPNFVHHTVYTSKRREIVTALHVAVDLSHYAAVEALLNVNADANIVDHNDETALHVAVKKADRVMTRMLLAKGADPSVVDRRGNAALHIATLFGHLQLVKTLLKYDADVYQRGASGAIPSHIAAREGHIHLIQVFCARDAGNINVKIPCFEDKREVAPLHLAAENGHVETVIALLDQFKADVNLRDSEGNTPLHSVVLCAYHPYRMRDRDFFYATAKVLVRYHVSINEKNQRGNTALHLAAAHHHPKIVELLLSVGANPFTENDDRMKPIDVVSESDPVTRQLLKTAMSNPLPIPLDASMVSLRRDLQNLSLPGMMVPPLLANGALKTSTLAQNAMMPNGQPPAFNHSFRSISSDRSSVFVDDTRARLAALQMTAKQRPEHNNEIALYSQVDKRATMKSTASRRSQQRKAMSPSSVDQSIVQAITQQPSRDDSKRQSRRHRPSSESTTRQRPSSDSFQEHSQSTLVSSKNKLNKERHSKSSTAPTLPPKGQSPRKDKVVYENVVPGGKKKLASNSQLNTSQTTGSRHQHRDAKKQHKVKAASSSEDEDEDEENCELAGAYRNGEEAGVRVHTVPGKPSTIEVEYSGGPIMISVDTQGDSLDESQQYYQQDSEAESEPDVQHAQKKETKDKKKHRQRDDEGKHRHRSHETTEDNESLHSSKKHKKKKDKEEPIYSNQEQIMAEIRRKQEQLERLAEQKQQEDERMQREAEIERQQEEDAKKLRKEERERRRLKKLQRRMQRQEIEQPEAPAVLEAKPTLVYPDEMWQDAMYDSDELETEQQATMERTKRKAVAVAESVIKRWSEAEDDWNEAHPAAHQTQGQQDDDDWPDSDDDTQAKQQPKKPPRPGYQAQSQSSSEDTSAATLPTPMPRTSIPGGKRFETVAREVEHIVTIERAALAVDKDKWVDAKVIEHPEQYAVEPLPDDLSSTYDAAASECSELMEPKQQRGLRMRVTGDMPKAYTRAEKSSARRAFMMAAPVSIESSSEASDAELSSSRLNISETLSEKSAQRRAEWSNWAEPMVLPTRESSKSKGKDAKRKATEGQSGSSQYPKPYTSFGKIEPQIDALEEAMREEDERIAASERETSFDSTTAPLPAYQILTPPGDSKQKLASVNNIAPSEGYATASVNKSSTPSVSLITATNIVTTEDLSSNSDSETVPGHHGNKPSRREQPASNLARSFEETLSGELEDYDEEPGTRRPGSLSRSLNDLEDYDNEPGTGKRRAAVPVVAEVTEVAGVEQQEGKAAKKLKKTKKTKPHVDVQLASEDRNVGKLTVHSPVIAADVWQEAMSTKPLASSESFDLQPTQPRNKGRSLEDLLKPPGKVTKSGVDLLSGDKNEEDMSHETLDDLSYDSFKPTQPVMSVVTRWDEQSLETNLDDYLANIDTAKTLDMHARSTAADSRVVGRRKERKGASKKKPESTETNLEEMAVEEQPKKQKKHVQEPDSVTASKPAAKRKEKPKPKRGSGAAIDLLRADSEVELNVDDEPYEGLGDISADVSVQLWQTEEDMDALPPAHAHDERWEEDSFGDADYRYPPHRLLPPAGFPAGSRKPEIVDVPPDAKRPPGGRLQNFLNADAGKRRPVQRIVPSRPYDAYMSETEVSRQQRFMSDQSDTESTSGQAQSGTNRPVPRRFIRQVHSEAEASDYEAPPALRPGRSVRQSALDAINRGVVPRRPRSSRSLILIQPGHHDKNFNHIRRMFKTPRRRTRGLTCVPSIGHYRDSLLSTSRQSFTESETETDDNKLNETSAIDFKQYDIIARLWMEQVDAKMVEKSDTMFLSVLPADRDLPRELTSSYLPPMQGTGDSALPPQWVIARGRTLLSRRQRRLEDGDKSNDEMMDMSRASSPGRQLILFFKVSGNWMDVAWVLFDGLQTDPETVRMIRDIQLKNPAGLAEQVHDLMHRWWHRKGHGATVSELQRALDFCHIPYIQEEYHDPRATIVSYTDTEDDLDIGQISDTDPDVTRLTHVYNVRSLNASFNVDNPPPLPSSSPPPLEPADSSDRERPARDHSPSSTVDVVLRNLQRAAARSHRRKLDSSVESTDTLDDKKRSLAIVHPQPQASSDKKHVTNL